MGVTATTRLPAGWYPDPEGGNHRRWWDGREWTEYTADFQRSTSVEELDLGDVEEPATASKPARAARRLRRVETAAVETLSEEAVGASEPRRNRAERLGRWLASAVHPLRSGSGRRANRSRR